MEKFSKVTESKRFIPDPSILKKYASYIIPLYINGILKCEEKLLDEYLDMYKTSNKYRNLNQVCDLEIAAIKNIFDNPTTISGFNQLKQDILNKTPRLQNFLRKYLQDTDQFK
jgi:hypothetical protein